MVWRGRRDSIPKKFRCKFFTFLKVLNCNQKKFQFICVQRIRTNGVVSTPSKHRNAFRFCEAFYQTLLCYDCEVALTTDKQILTGTVAL